MTLVKELLRRALRNQGARVNHPRCPLFFDPQTVGGLLTRVPADQVESCVAELRKLGCERTCVIGRILAQGASLEPIVLVELARGGYDG